MNTWGITDEIRNKFKPIVEEHIKKAEEADEFRELELTFQGISPAQLKDLMVELGYEEESMDNNGWQWDFWIEMINESKAGISRRACISGCGMAFSLVLAIGE